LKRFRSTKPGATLYWKKLQEVKFDSKKPKNEEKNRVKKAQEDEEKMVFFFVNRDRIFFKVLRELAFVCYCCAM
jgi:hypothetical protein